MNSSHSGIESDVLNYKAGLLWRKINHRAGVLTVGVDRESSSGPCLVVMADMNSSPQIPSEFGGLCVRVESIQTQD